MGTGNLGQGTGDRDLGQGTWAWGEGTWDRELGAANWDRELPTTVIAAALQAAEVATAANVHLPIGTESTDPLPKDTKAEIILGQAQDRLS